MLRNTSTSSAATPRLRRRKGTTTTIMRRMPPLGGSVFVLAAIAILACSVVLTLRALGALYSRLQPSSPQDAAASAASASRLLVWCQSSECENRLEELQSKLALEDEIYRDQFSRERHRSRHRNGKNSEYRQYTRAELTNFFALQIRADFVSERVKGRTSADFSRLGPEAEWVQHGSFPEINVIGNLKTGTSQLFNIFATHRDTVDIPEEWKEHCSDDHYGNEGTPEDTYQYALHGWHEFYYDHKAPAGSNKRQVNGCMELEDLQQRIVYNPPNPGTKFFILVRDPADWAWAAYNFWTVEGWDTNYGREDAWVKDAETQYRSPEAFHESILAGDLTETTDRFNVLKQISVERLRRMAALVGKDNLIVLKNEDLSPSRIHESGLLERLVEATGLSIDGFDENLLHSRSNCNSNKGFDTLCSDNEREHAPQPFDARMAKTHKEDKKTLKQRQQRQRQHVETQNNNKTDLADVENSSFNVAAEGRRGLETTGGKPPTKPEQQEQHQQEQQQQQQQRQQQHSASRTVGYPVTHYRPMLESTRRFIYLQWHTECKVWAEEFGVEYTECLAAIPDDDIKQEDD